MVKDLFKPEPGEAVVHLDVGGQLRHGDGVHAACMELPVRWLVPMRHVVPEVEPVAAGDARTPHGLCRESVWREIAVLPRRRVELRHGTVMPLVSARWKVAPLQGPLTVQGIGLCLAEHGPVVYVLPLMGGPIVVEDGERLLMEARQGPNHALTVSVSKSWEI